MFHTSVKHTVFSQLMKCTHNSWVHKCMHTPAIQAPMYAWLPMHMCIHTQTQADSPFQSQLWTLTQNYSQSQVCAQSVPIAANLWSAERQCWQLFPSMKTHTHTHIAHSLTQTSILTVQIVLVMGSTKLLYHHGSNLNYAVAPSENIASDGRRTFVLLKTASMICDYSLKQQTKTTHLWPKVAPSLFYLDLNTPRDYFKPLKNSPSYQKKKNILRNFVYIFNHIGITKASVFKLLRWMFL